MIEVDRFHCRHEGNKKMRILALASLLTLLCAADADAKVVKLGDMVNGGRQGVSTRAPVGGQIKPVISCFENGDCAADQACRSLQCENVCKSNTCPTGKHCAPAGSDAPHEYLCVQCVNDYHCPQGMVCGADHFCAEPEAVDPCLNAVCPPAAPYCTPQAYQSLPYTCVQCTENSHCPPVAGLTRSCIDGFCLFNIDGNIPAQQQPAAATATDTGSGEYDEYGEYSEYGEEGE